MTKWKCTAKLPYGLAYCAGVCELTTLNKTDEPSCCVIHHINGVKWKRVSEEPEQKQKSETELPDWCKVGEWCFCLDDDGNYKYFKITHIKGTFIYGGNWNIAYPSAKPARLRPYNTAEMKELVGKVIEHDGNASLVIVYLKDGFIRVGTIAWVSAERLIEDGYTIDGNPCGVLEHLNDNGEWVE